MPSAITSFYANAFPTEVVLKAHEIDTYLQDTGYVQYLVVSPLLVSVMFGGLFQEWLNAAREYEKAQSKSWCLHQLLLWAIQTGKILGALILNSLPIVVALISVDNHYVSYSSELYNGTLIYWDIVPSQAKCPICKQKFIEHSELQDKICKMITVKQFANTSPGFDVEFRPFFE